MPWRQRARYKKRHNRHERAYLPGGHPLRLLRVWPTPGFSFPPPLRVSAEGSTNYRLRWSFRVIGRHHNRSVLGALVPFLRCNRGGQQLDAGVPSPANKGGPAILKGSRSWDHTNRPGRPSNGPLHAGASTPFLSAPDRLLLRANSARMLLDRKDRGLPCVQVLSPPAHRATNRHRAVLQGWVALVVLFFVLPFPLP
jgi:hypothetical protein